MRTSSARAAILGLPAAVAAVCANNCGRAVAGEARDNPPFIIREAQCSAFVTSTATFTPEAVTVTIDPVPTFATECDGITEYWSACQCFTGVAPTVVTLTVPTPTVYVTATVNVPPGPIASS
ncbi:peptidase s8 and s53 subtilisin kexin sedolisin [Colletotrichum truncatum]|uniref:Peptidase s8 and s53 subtilisin kexin sedolisin n=1 Tax=Colletotrichum truncatum TaxID=5467 RepID=A0ACC3ZHD6_COLTU|nr:peptidase s8 and s53 subtilisin kexin sedolisin [Colletotrichum truncatum]KAF6782274.1 peptidase s8 and s53 subtilisin kexin sedolisin [Colletotrichum truncatum]